MFVDIIRTTIGVYILSLLKTKYSAIKTNQHNLANLVISRLHYPGIKEIIIRNFGKILSNGLSDIHSGYCHTTK